MDFQDDISFMKALFANESGRTECQFINPQYDARGLTRGSAGPETVAALQALPGARVIPTAWYPNVLWLVSAQKTLPLEII